ncbi:MAG: glycosyltransferase family 39 protein [Edaphobacter sp.]|uniref:glycosyltransferase family 39 protein n=1 Tax=Edaphobacter sp. TaxID=1934404 RepID=UPI00239C10F1|nr:glycosyltransferase family 39 protein [Edaphobacter sp.]MDE1175181.1 glycosyltransferase family 39 protein [Edaphobacter sp.]
MNRKVYAIVQSRWFLPGIAVFAVIIRLALILVTHKYKTEVFADEIDYKNIGISIEHGLGFIKDGIHPTAYRPPAQPFVIAGLFRLFGDNDLYVKLFEALLLLVVPFVCFRVGRLLGLSVAASNIGAAIATLHPALAYASSTLYPTVLTAVALTVAVWLCSIAMEKNRAGAAVGAGLAFGIAGAATTTFAPLGAIAAGILLLRRSYRSALIVGVLGMLPTVIWMSRNQHAMGQFTVATNGGYNLYLGANDGATPMSGNWVDPHLFDESTMSETALDGKYRDAAVSWIKQHPAHWGELVVERAIVVFDSVGNPRTQGLHSGLLAHLVGWIMLPVVLLSVVGLVVCYRNPLSWLTTAALLLVIASSAATIAKPRFRFPCDPLLAEFSVAGFLVMKEKLSPGERQEAADHLAA